ncbi:MAG: DUF1156 domain-containing protein [Candidatus Thorarchaeota archaeon]
MHKGGSTLPKRAIEITFPIAEVNRIAEKESTGFGRRHYRPVYVMHKWWARRLGSIFRAILLYSLADDKLSEWDQNPHNLWEFFSKTTNLEEKIVLDPMMGGGTTVVEALRLGCKVVAGDLNPVSWYVVKKQIEDIDSNLLKTALSQLELDLGVELRKYYKTACPECENDAEAIYYFHCKELDCPDCDAKISFMKNFYLAKSPVGKGDVVVCPECWDVFETKSAKSHAICPKCATKFVPKEVFSARKRKYYCSNGCEPKKIASSTTNSPLGYRQYAIEFYCKSCDIEKNPKLKKGRGYKKSDDRDLRLLENAEKEYRRIRRDLPIPDTKIPEGVETRRALNHGYAKFRDMFGPRQLLNLGKIYRWILNYDDWKTKEFLILAFSNSLKYNNLFAKYNATQGFITDIFRTHSYSPSMSPVEANCYDTVKGRGSFTAFVNLVIEGKEYCRQPFERVFKKDKIQKFYTKNPIIGNLSDNFEDLTKNGNVLLRCGSSERINIPNKSVDAVVTDPPYYGNVMYSELSNFFYVWLRIALKDKYSHFSTELVQDEKEVIENRVQGKGEKEFLEGLTRVFSESRRILKDNGVFVFTFHHKSGEVWGTILRCILDSGLFVSAVYPVRSEMKASTHLYDALNITMDIVLVCRKRTKSAEPEDWKHIQQAVKTMTLSLTSDLEKSGEVLSPLDIYMMAFGKCLELYSQHYPHVLDGEKQIGIKEAIDSIRCFISDSLDSSTSH